MLGTKMVRKGLWNRLTVTAGVEPLTALAIAYSCYPSANQPHSLRAKVAAQQASSITEGYLDKGLIDLDTCCRRLFGMSSDEVTDTMLEDGRLNGAGTFYALLKR